MNNSTVEKKELRKQIIKTLRTDNINFLTPFPFREYEQIEREGFFLILSAHIEDVKKIFQICKESICSIKMHHIGRVSKLLFLSYESSFGFILFPDKSEIGLDQRIISLKRESYFIDALQKIRSTIGKRNLTNILDILVLADTQYKCHILNIAKEDFYKREFIAQLLEYKSLFIAMKKNNSLLSQKEKHFDIQYFARLYYIIINTISKEIGFDNNLTIHEAETSDQFFSFLVSVLANETDINIKEIISSDLSTFIKYNTKRINQYHIDNQLKNYVQATLIDIKNECFYIPMADVTVNLNVLEYMEDELMAKKALCRLWERTSKLLVVYVHIEDFPDKDWGRNIGFTPEKLLKMCDFFFEGELISDKIRSSQNKTLLDEGFLIVKRSKNE